MDDYVELALNSAVRAKGSYLSAFALWVVIGSQVQLQALTKKYRKAEFLGLSELRPLEYAAGSP